MQSKFDEYRSSLISLRTHIFLNNVVLNTCRYLKGFYTYEKINNTFLKFHYYLLRMPNIIEIG